MQKGSKFFLRSGSLLMGMKFTNDAIHVSLLVHEQTTTQCKGYSVVCDINFRNYRYAFFCGKIIKSLSITSAAT